MKLLDLWKVADGQRMFIVVENVRRDHVLDGPGFPVVNGCDASNQIVRNIKPAHYPTYGNVLEVFLSDREV